MIRTLKLLDLSVDLDIAQYAFGHFSLDRFPVIQRDLDGGEPSEKRLLEVKSMAFDPAVFALPAGLRRVAPFAFYTDDGVPRGSSDDEEVDAGQH